MVDDNVNFLVKKLTREIKKLKKLVDKKGSALEELQYIFSKMPGYIYWKNKKSEYQGCNENLAKFSNLENPSDIVGMTDYDFAWGKKQADQFRQDDLEIIRHKKHLVTEYQLSQKREDGNYLYVRTEKMPFYDKKGKIGGVLAIAIDITDQKLLEEKLAETKVREAHFKAMSAIGGMLAHELRTPLSSIAVNAQIIKECFPVLLKAYLEYSKIADIETIRKAQLKNLDEITDDIEQSANYASNTIDTILTGFHYASSESAPIKEIDINAVVEQALSDYPLNKAESDLITFQPIKKSKALGSPSVIIHVLHNLLKNALYAIKKAGKGVITISLNKLQDDSIQLVFKDTGEGISEEVRKHIFEPFYTTKDSETSIGLGLYFCRLALSKMGGTIKCQSKKGVYTTFIINLKSLPS